MIDKKKILILGGIFAGFIVVISIIVVLITVFNNSSDNTQKVEDDSLESRYVDPYSGETVYTQDSRTPEAFGDTNTITYLGFTKLIDYGLSTVQQQSIKNSISDFSSHGDVKISEVTIDPATLTQTIDQDTGQKNITFEIVVNRDENKRYTLRNTYSSFSDMFTKITAGTAESNGQVIYDSNQNDDHAQGNL